MKRTISLIMLVASCIPILMGACTAAREGPVNLRVNVNLTGTSAHIIGITMAGLLEKYSDRIRFTVIPAGGGEGAQRLLLAEKMDLSFTSYGMIYEMYTGTGRFKEGEPAPGLRSMWPAFPTYLHIVVKKGSPINTLADLSGKKVGDGTTGSTAEYIMLKIFEVTGIKPSKITYLPAHADRVAALKEGSVDCVFWTLGIGSPSMVDLAMTEEIRFLPIPDDVAKKLADIGLATVVFPKGVYKGVDKDVQAVADIFWLFTHERLPEDYAYEITKIYWQHRDEAAKIHEKNVEVQPENVANWPRPVPMHAGALKYFKEVGIIK